ncbi:hypothetical protein [Amycolatopsis sp. cmx-4-61]|uniref:hypothetical protein n=1 Tax=Amycolatopsis sp. cmx-4-61 TaxID=2790937 RepID=UPI00397ACCC4
MVELRGDDYAENTPGSRTLWRDHGLVEFFRHRGRAREPWAGEHFPVQAHRRRYPGPRLVNRVLRDRYGDFPGPVTFDEAGALLARRAMPLAEVPYPDELRTYWQPSARIMVHVAAGSSAARPGDLHRVVSRSAGIP